MKVSSPVKRCGFFRLALDDFDTGYSSLSYLKHLPLDQLKIYQLFVQQILLNDSNSFIVNAIITLGKSLGLSLITEG